MWCIPCQKKAAARKQAMMNRIATIDKSAAIKFEKATPKPTTLPRYEWPTVSIDNWKSTTVWNAWYQAFMMRKK